MKQKLRMMKIPLPEQPTNNHMILHDTKKVDPPSLTDKQIIPLPEQPTNNHMILKKLILRV